ncbi:hypothetical protein [Streptomyces halstedii]|uniref:hypothetical protein n=1 Tax=Streptomyces halstedii TaxID=1944 RepID=UPI0037F7E247
MEPTTAQDTTQDLCICGHEKREHITDPLTCYGCQGGEIELVHRYTPVLAVIRN